MICTMPNVVNIATDVRITRLWTTGGRSSGQKALFQHPSCASKLNFLASSSTWGTAAPTQSLLLMTRSRREYVKMLTDTQHIGRSRIS